MCQLCGTKLYWEVLRANCVAQSSTGKYFVQALYYKVVLGSTSRKLCSTKSGSFVVHSSTGKYFVHLCASFVVRSGTGEYFAQAL